MWFQMKPPNSTFDTIRWTARWNIWNPDKDNLMKGWQKNSWLAKNFVSREELIGSLNLRFFQLL